MDTFVQATRPTVGPGSGEAPSAATTAVVLIGYQNDYFSVEGALRSAFEDPEAPAQVLARTVVLLRRLGDTEALIVSAPIAFTPDYSELEHAVGILAAVKEAGAFRAGSRGVLTVEDVAAFGDRVTEVPGKRGLNAFSNTALDDVLRAHGISDLVIAGALTSVCVDSTGRAARDLGYRVSVLSDCTLGRTAYEDEFFRTRIFPLYAEVLDAPTLVSRLCPVDDHHVA